MPSACVAGRRLSPAAAMTRGTSSTLWSTAWLLLLLLLPLWIGAVGAMRPDQVARLRQETVDMFYHGFDNYMGIAFPEDEVNYTPDTSIWMDC